MKPILKLSTLLAFCLFFQTTLFAATISLVTTNANCPANGRISVNVSSGVAPIKYELQFPDGSKTPVQTTNLFTDLAPGTYKVNVYDAMSGASIAASATAKVGTTYSEFYLQSPLVGINQNILCLDNGTLNVSLSGGKAPYRCKVSSVNGYSNELTSYSAYFTFAELKSGSYKVEAWDNCGSYRTTINPLTVTSDGAPLANVQLKSVNLDLNIANNNFFFWNNSCTELAFNNQETAIIIMDQHNNRFNTVLAKQGNVYHRLEYPLGTYGPWNSFNFGTTRYIIKNYNSSDNRYRFQVMSKCDSVIVSTPIYTFPPLETVKDYRPVPSVTSIYTDYTHFRDSITIILWKENVSSSGVITSTCNLIKVTAVPRGGGITVTAILQNRSRFDFTSKDLVAGKTYDLKIEDLGTPGGIWNKVVTIPISNLETVIFNSIRPQEGYCEFDKIRIQLGIQLPSSYDYDNNFKDTVTYKVLSGPPLPPLIVADSINGSGQYVIRTHDSEWKNAPYGNYQIEASFASGRLPIINTYNLEKEIDGFQFDSISYTQSAACGLYRIKTTGHYYGPKGPIIPEDINSFFKYSVVVLSGPAGTQDMYTEARTGEEMIMDNMPGGEYVLGYSNPSNRYNPESCVYTTQKLSIPVHLHPTFSIQLSGGISCSSGLASLTASVTGSSPPFQFRIKKETDTDDKYSPWQLNNIFLDQEPGNYTVQSVDQCASITTQKLRVFNGTDQFLGINGEIENGTGKVCRGRPTQLTVLSIGPVVWYKWYKKNGQQWDQLASTGPTYDIPNMQDVDKGVYKVVINNGTCELQNEVSLNELIEPTIKPIVEGSTTFCNTQINLRSTTNNLLYQWYKDNVSIPGATNRTFAAQTIGSYSLIATEFGGCPSDPSEPHVITAGTKDVCSAFSDTVWFFGQNYNGEMSSPGIVFKNDVMNEASGLTNVNSTGTNFSMGVKICDNYSFYSTYAAGSGIMYNRKNLPMLDGTFPAPANSTDGYAGAYIGGNKYAFFVVSPDGDLNYYIVDMNADGGNGKLIFQKTVATGISQAIELFPREGTTDQYWLIYFNIANNEMFSDLLSGSSLINASSITYAISSPPINASIMAKSSNNKLFAVLSFSGASNTINVFELNASTGAMQFISRNFPMILDEATALSFSPDGLYYAVATGSAQFHVFGINWGNYGLTEFTTGGHKGGGLKLGPDGIMYHKTDKGVYAVIWNGYQISDYYEVTKVPDEGTNFSIGLTAPANFPSNLRISNQAPVAVTDNEIVYKGTANKIYPTINDLDPDGDKIFLSDVYFEDPNHVVKGALGSDLTLKEITFTPSNTYVFVPNEEVVLKYEIRDSTVLNSRCTTGRIVLKMGKSVLANNDNDMVFACGTKTVDVMNNDDVLLGTQLSIKQQGKLGSSSIVNDKLVYDHSGVNCQSKIGKDTVHYTICHLGDCSDAVLVIEVLKNPNLELRDSCSFKPIMRLDIQYSGTYQWQYSIDGTVWSDLSYTSVTCPAINSGYFRIKLMYKGMETYSIIRKLIEDKKILINGETWYQMRLE